MLRLTLGNVRNISGAEIDIDPIAVVVGKRGAGKTTVCSAAALVMTGEKKHFAGNAEAFKAAMLSEGTKRGEIRLDSDGGSRRVDLPGGAVKEGGEDPPKASHIALGMWRFGAMSFPDKSKLFAEVFKAGVTDGELRKKLVEDVGDPGDDPGSNVLLDGLIRDIKTNGWDQAWKGHQTEATGLKRVWEDTTREKWGAAKAAAWMPAGEDFEEDEGFAAGLQAEAVNANEALGLAHQQLGSNAGDRERLTEIAGTLDKAKQARLQAETDWAKADKEFQALTAELEKLPPEEVVCTCPECGVDVAIVDGRRLAKSKGYTAKDAMRRKDLGEKLRFAKASLDGCSRRVDASNEAVAVVEKARASLATLKEGAAGAQEAVEAAKARVAAADARLKTFRAWKKASETHAAIVRHLKIAEILAPTGIRQAKAVEVLHLVNHQLEELSTAAGWPEVRLSPDFEVSRGGRAYGPLCESERWMADTIIQMVFARADGSDFVVLDENGQMRKENRAKLFRAIKAAGVPCLIAMMLQEPRKIPDLSGMGARTYFLEEGGQVVPREGEEEREAA